MYIRHARPVTHPANIQIFQYDMVFYLGNLEVNFIGTGAMKRSNEIQAPFTLHRCDMAPVRFLLYFDVLFTLRRCETA